MLSFFRRSRGTQIASPPTPSDEDTPAVAPPPALTEDEIPTVDSEAKAATEPSTPPTDSGPATRSVDLFASSAISTPQKPTRKLQLAPSRAVGIVTSAEPRRMPQRRRRMVDDDAAKKALAEPPAEGRTPMTGTPAPKTPNTAGPSNVPEAAATASTTQRPKITRERLAEIQANFQVRKENRARREEIIRGWKLEREEERSKPPIDALTKLPTDGETRSSKPQRQAESSAAQRKRLGDADPRRGPRDVRSPDTTLSLTKESAPAIAPMEVEDIATSPSSSDERKPKPQSRSKQSTTIQQSTGMSTARQGPSKLGLQRATSPTSNTNYGPQANLAAEAMSPSAVPSIETASPKPQQQGSLPQKKRFELRLGALKLVTSVPVGSEPQIAESMSVPIPSMETTLTTLDPVPARPAKRPATHESFMDEIKKRADAMTISEIIELRRSANEHSQALDTHISPKLSSEGCGKPSKIRQPTKTREKILLEELASRESARDVVATIRSYVAVITPQVDPPVKLTKTIAPRPSSDNPLFLSTISLESAADLIVTYFTEINVCLTNYQATFPPSELALVLRKPTSRLNTIHLRRITWTREFLFLGRGGLALTRLPDNFFADLITLVEETIAKLDALSKWKSCSSIWQKGGKAAIEVRQKLAAIKRERSEEGKKKWLEEMAQADAAAMAEKTLDGKTS